MRSDYSKAFGRPLVLLGLALLALQGCGSSEGQDTFYVARAINMVVDSPVQSIDVGQLNFQAAFGTGSGYSSAFAGSDELEIRGFVPGANPGDTFDDTLVLRPAETIEFADRTSYTVITYGTVANFQALVLTAPLPDTVDSTSIQMRFVHVAPVVGNVDIYVSEPGADLGSTPTVSLATGNVSSFSQQPVANYRLRITAAGSSEVIYDSGTIINAGSGERTFVIGPTVGPTPVPVFVARWTNQSAPVAIADIDTPAFVRLTHLSPGDGALDLYAEDDYANAIALDTAYAQVSGYGAVRDSLPDGINASAGSGIDFAASAVDPEDGDLAASLSWSSSIDGPLAGTGPAFTETLSAGNHSVIASVSDSSGLAGAAAVPVNMLVASNAAPSVQVLTPQNGDQIAAGNPATFTARADDAEDGDLTAGLSWTSNIDGDFAETGGSVTATLSPGVHAVTATALDTAGLAGSESVIVNITEAGNQPPAVAITSPDLISLVELDLTSASNPGDVLFQEPFEIFNGTAYTLVVTGSASGLDGTIVADQVQRAATHALVRVVNASALAGAVDVYVTPVGAGIADANPFVANAAVGLATGVGALASGNYDITFTTTGSSDVLATIENIGLDNAQSTLLALLDSADNSTIVAQAVND